VVVPTPLYRLYVYRSFAKIVEGCEMIGLAFVADAAVVTVEVTTERSDCVLITTVDCDGWLCFVQWCLHHT
jgi:hypothetical protein